MERFVRGDIVIIDFPYSDMTAYKKRPALIIKVPKGEDVLICQITGSSFEKSVEIPINENDFQQGKLKRESFVRIDKLSSVEKFTISYKAGYLKSEKFREIIDKIIDFLRE